MRHCLGVWIIVMVCGNGFLAVAHGATVKPASEQAALGKAVFEKSCKWCHGVKGKGDGPAAFFHQPYSGPRARDFTIANYRFRSTPSGYLPTDQDLFRTITKGIPGRMPSFAGLREIERWQVIAYIKAFNTDPESETSSPIVMREIPVPASSDSTQRGRVLYFQLDCHSCHGEDARGWGPVAMGNELRDDQDLVTFPTNLTNRPGFKNGSSARDIVRTLLTGLDGSPMPSYASQFEEQPDDVWHLANYIRSLSSSR